MFRNTTYFFCEHEI